MEFEWYCHALFAFSLDEVLLVPMEWEAGWTMDLV